ncbi:ketopantoate reductase family protein [Methanoregula sp.]|uniref:ketopantoate reductase family protein n=1 Tax=Methanoregula sp. TaxID=2052170 RepID=UPI003BB16226
MKIPVLRARAVGLSVAAKLSGVCDVHAVTRKPTAEIDFLNGAIVAKGAVHGIPTPVNSSIVDLVKFRESLETAGAPP